MSYLGKGLGFYFDIYLSINGLIDMAKMIFDVGLMMKQSDIIGIIYVVIMLWLN